MYLRINLRLNNIFCYCLNFAFLSLLNIKFLNYKSVSGYLWYKVFSIVGTKCAIFVNLLYTTNILLDSCANSNFVIKSTMIWAQAFSSTIFGINFPIGVSVQFLFLWYTSHPSIYFLTFFVISSYQKFLVTNFIIFYCSPCSLTSISWYSQITSTFSFSSLETYIFLFLNISLFFSCYSLSLNIFTSAHFTSSIAFITLL